jgi:hypothetical protein
MFLASVSGGSTIRAPAAAFVAAFVRRVESGLLAAGPPSRNRYQVTRQRPDGLAFRAADWWTAVNVGLNDVDVAVGDDGRVRYDVRYARWAAYVIGLGGVLGVILIAVFVAIDIRTYIARHVAARISRWSIDQNVALVWTMVLFWGFAWPWFLISLHKRPLRRLIERIIQEVDAAAGR